MDTQKKGNDGATQNAGGTYHFPMYVIYYTHMLHNVNICQHLMPSFATIRLTVPVCTLTSLVMTPSSLRLVNTWGGVSPYQRFNILQHFKVGVLPTLTLAFV